jgi:GNAT superfamily N-acetyltransferase
VYESDITLRDGTKAHVRPAGPDDRKAVVAFYERLTERSLYLRFHHLPRRTPDEELSDFDAPGHGDNLLLLAWHEERIIALASYRRSAEQEDHADIAFAVEDSHQHLGVATQMLRQLAAAARDHEIKVFQADVLDENRDMLDVLRSAGLDLTATLKFGTYHISFPI